MAIASESKLITAEEYLGLPDTGEPTELVRGIVVAMNQPGFRHGKVCTRLISKLDRFVEEHKLGHILSNDAGVIVQRRPDTVRGPDVSYFSFARVPKELEPVGYVGAVPEIVFEVLSPGNTRRDVSLKIGEYLNAGVNVVCIVDPEARTVDLHYPNRRPRVLEQAEDLLTFDDLPGFALPIARLFSSTAI